MAGLFDIPSYLAGGWLVAALVGLGLVVGVMTGLFGVGGAFMITPLLNVLLGIPYTMAAGSSMSFIIGTSAAGCLKHWRIGNVAAKTMTILAGGGVCGAILGAELHLALAQRLAPLGAGAFTALMHGLFILVLLATAAIVVHWSPREGEGHSLLQRLRIGPYITVRRAGLAGVSLPGLCAVGLMIGVFAGLLGIGGGILYMPVMLLVVGLSVQQAAGTSLGIVLLTGMAGAVMYGQHGQVRLWVAMPLLVGSTIGVQMGVWLCRRLHGDRIRRYFALLALLVAAVLAWDLARRLMG